MTITDGLAVVLESDESFPRHILNRLTEFIPRALRILMGRVPLIHVHINDLLPVHDDVDHRPHRLDGHVIPLVGGLVDRFTRREAVVNRPALAVGGAVAGIVDLHLDGILYEFS